MDKEDFVEMMSKMMVDFTREGFNARIDASLLYKRGGIGLTMGSPILS